MSKTIKSGHLATFDFFKILAAFGVVFGHAFINFFAASYNETHDVHWRFDAIEAICVSVFFIISGIFIGNSIEKQNETQPFDAFAFTLKKRILRLWEPSLFATVLYLLINCFIQHNLETRTIPLYWPVLVLMGNINMLPGNNILWYVAALFWCSLPITALLCYSKKISLSIIFPLIFFIGLSFLYNTYGSLAVHSWPLVSNFFSAGLLKALVELVFGIEIFYCAKLFQQRIALKNNAFTKAVIVVLEVLCVLGMLYIITHSRYLTQYNFAIYPCCFILFVICLIHREVLFGFCKRTKKPISFFSKYTFMLYLTHTLLLQPLAQLHDFSKCNITATLFFALFACIFFAIVIYHLHEVIRRLLKKFIYQLIDENNELKNDDQQESNSKNDKSRSFKFLAFALFSAFFFFFTFLTFRDANSKSNLTDNLMSYSEKSIGVDAKSKQKISTEFLLMDDRVIEEVSFRAFTWNNDYGDNNLVLSIKNADSEDNAVYETKVPLNSIKDNKLTSIPLKDCTLPAGNYIINFQTENDLDADFALAANPGQPGHKVIYDGQTLSDTDLCVEIIGKPAKR